MVEYFELLQDCKLSRFGVATSPGATVELLDTMGTQAVLVETPWQILGGYKYVIYLPFLIKAVHTHLSGRGHGIDNWCFHMLLASGLRFLQGQLWMSFSRLHCICKKHQINTSGVTFEQVDREFHTDDHVILQVFLATVAHAYLPGFQALPFWNGRGMVTLVLLHMGPTELLYYWVHRAMHTGCFFRNYHSLHHESVHTEPATSGVSTFLEHVLYAGLMGIAMGGTALLGGASISMIYLYWLTFDFFKNLAHCNVEIVPVWIFQSFPILKYLVITPTYHSLHHTEKNSNYCLFMPLYDHMGGSVNPRTRKLHALLRQGRKEQVPDFVFLAHCVDLCSSVHVSFMFRSVAAQPWTPHWYFWPILPVVTIWMIIVWIWGKAFVAYQYVLDNVSAQTWVVPRYGFQVGLLATTSRALNLQDFFPHILDYFIPFRLDSINALIESAILDADKMGVKVISLGALNKNEALNGGGTLFVEKHKKLRVRVVHGNTLTAACIIHGLPKTVTEVFMTGATSKLGRAIALCLCRRRVRVLMLTSSQDRFAAILREVPQDSKHFLVRVTKYQAGKNCKTWIMGKWIANADQQWAPKGTHFHQFVVPPVPKIRNDCKYGKLAAMHLPKQVQGISTCESWCDRLVVHACHAGGLVHCLEGWTHHEVGSINIDRIDIVWAAAMKHGFALDV